MNSPYLLRMCLGASAYSAPMWLGSVSLLLAVLSQSVSVMAVPLNVNYADDPKLCDPIPGTPLRHELGGQRFPIDEQIRWTTRLTTRTICTADLFATNDWEVQITNLGTKTWKDLFFVADDFMTLGNADGHVDGLIGSLAFQIKPFGPKNANLIAESIRNDLLFQPQETWRFLVTDFGLLPLGVPGRAPDFSSIGLGAASLPPIEFTSTASIVANEYFVPEPTSVALCAVSLAILLGRKRKQSLAAPPATFPRLGLACSLSWSLRNTHERSPPPAEPIVDFSDASESQSEVYAEIPSFEASDWLAGYSSFLTAAAVQRKYMVDSSCNRAALHDSSAARPAARAINSAGTLIGSATA